MTATVPQHLKALETANRRRIIRSEFKRELRSFTSPQAARARLAELLPTLSDDLVGMRVCELVDACRRTGPKAVEVILGRAQISHTATVKSLTERQLDALVSSLTVSVDKVQSRRRDVAYCPRCKQDTLLLRNGRCVWCHSKTEVAA